MTGFAFSVFAICLVGGIALLLCYGPDRGESLAVGIITLSVILTPLVREAAELDPEDWLDSVRGEVSEVSPEYIPVLEQAFSDGIKRAVAEKFSFNEDNVRISLVGFDAEKMRAERIRIVLRGSAALSDYRAVEKYINGLDLGECNVQIEIG